MRAPLRLLHAVAVVLGVTGLAFSGWASADPPSRVARLGYLTGAVSWSPAGEDDWIEATINRPLTTGDRLWADARARAEIQVGGAMIRMNAETSLAILDLDDQIAQLQLTQGALNIRVRRLDLDQAVEIDTPNLAFTVRQPGEYRVEVDPDGNATTIVVRKGQGDVYGEGAAYVIDARQPYRFTGTGLREYEFAAVPYADEFDRWSSERDRLYDNSASARYVSPDVVGYQDLDANGAWRVDATYGNIWTPNRVAAGWVPYRDGHWTWVDPWGWTWVDDAPWGFAVSHYGRWANFSGTWGWIPGPVRARAYYAPALVVFVGGDNFQVAISSGTVGAVAWFPLAPREVYRPSYAVSRRYFENVNNSNTVVNTTIINNTYNNTNVTNIVYANRQVNGAVVAVPATTFVQSRPVSAEAVRVAKDVMVNRPVAIAPSLAPTEKSVRGAAAQGGKPPSKVLERPVVARNAPPATHVGFAAQQPQLAATPGKPLDEAARKQLNPAASAPAPIVKVIAKKEDAPPTKPLPAVAAGPKPSETRQGEARGKSDEQRPSQPPAVANAPAPMPKAAPVQTAPQVPAAQPAEQRAKAEQPGKGQQREQPRAPAAAPPAPAAAASAPVAPPVSAAPSHEQRARSEQPRQPAPAPTAAAQVAQPVPAVRPPEQRAQPEQRDGTDPRTQPAPQPRAQPAPPKVTARAQEPLPAPAAQGGSKEGKAAPDPVTKQGEQRVPVAESRPPQPKAAAKAEPRDPEPKAAQGRSNDAKKNADEQPREEENRKQKP
jgi:hypothetical protein